MSLKLVILMPKQLFLKIREIIVNKIIPYSNVYFVLPCFVRLICLVSRNGIVACQENKKSLNQQMAN